MNNDTLYDFNITLVKRRWLLIAVDSSDTGQFSKNIHWSLLGWRVWKQVLAGPQKLYLYHCLRWYKGRSPRNINY